MVEGRGGEEWYSSRTRTGANILYGGRAGWGGAVLLSHTYRYRSQYVVLWKGGVENDGLGRCNCMLLDQRHIARTRTGANSIAWWKGGVEKNGVLFAHVPEPNEFFL